MSTMGKPEWMIELEKFWDRRDTAGFYELVEIIKNVEQETRESIKNDIVQFAIEGKFDSDEMKGLALYTKIIQYFESLKHE